MCAAKSAGVLVVFGTRPEAIKLAPVIFALRDRGSRPLVCFTGQHDSLVRQSLPGFSIEPDYALDVMRPEQELAAVTTAVLEKMRALLAEVRPGLVLVQGDTTSAFAAALAAFYERTPVGHVEAGLRTGDMANPFPEEMNRTLISRLAGLHFAPTEGARQNLLREGVAPHTVHVTGNTIVDAMQWVRERWEQGALEQVGEAQRLLADLKTKGFGRFVLVTCHRRESFGEGMAAICAALAEIAAAHPEVAVLFPVHPNPRVRETVFARLQGIANVWLVEPVPYPDFLYLLRHAALALTDSGGVQEEAPSFGVPAIVLRKVTERNEGVEAGLAALAGTDPERIRRLALDWLEHPPDLQNAANPYGDGKAAQRIADILSSRPA